MGALSQGLAPVWPAFSPYDQEMSTAQRRGVYDLTRVNAERAADYGRVDVRVDRTFRVGERPLNIFVGLQNVTRPSQLCQLQMEPPHRQPAVR
jgi:hypothetical protein